jgi:hypothetical protein
MTTSSDDRIYQPRHFKKPPEREAFLRVTGFADALMEFQYCASLPAGARLDFNTGLDLLNVATGVQSIWKNSVVPGEQRSIGFFSFDSLLPVPPGAEATTWRQSHWGKAVDSSIYTDYSVSQSAGRPGTTLDSLGTLLYAIPNAHPKHVCAALEQISKRFPGLLFSFEPSKAKKSAPRPREIPQTLIHNGISWRASPLMRTEIDSLGVSAYFHVINPDTFKIGSKVTDLTPWADALRAGNAAGPQYLETLMRYSIAKADGDEIRAIAQLTNSRTRRSGFGLLDAVLAADANLFINRPGENRVFLGLNANTPNTPRFWLDGKHRECAMQLDPERVLELCRLCASNRQVAALIGSDFGLLANDLHVVAVMARLVPDGCAENVGVRAVLDSATLTFPQVDIRTTTPVPAHDPEAYKAALSVRNTMEAAGHSVNDYVWSFRSRGAAHLLESEVHPFKRKEQYAALDIPVLTLGPKVPVAPKLKWIEGSAALNKDGHPLDLYHATAFDSDRFSSFPLCLTPEFGAARAFAQRNQGRLPKGTEPDVHYVHANIKNPKVYEKHEITALLDPLNKVTLDYSRLSELATALERDGHDGIVLKKAFAHTDNHGNRTEHDQWVAFRADQLRAGFAPSMRIKAFPYAGPPEQIAAARRCLEDSEIDGDVDFPGVHANIVANKGKYAAIYSWSGDGSGRTRAALAALKDFAGTVGAVDIGEEGSESFKYWTKMQAEGLVDELFDDLENMIPPPMSQNVPMPQDEMRQPANPANDAALPAGSEETETRIWNRPKKLDRDSTVPGSIPCLVGIHKSLITQRIEALDLQAPPIPEAMDFAEQRRVRTMISLAGSGNRHALSFIREQVDSGVLSASLWDCAVWSATKSPSDLATFVSQFGSDALNQIDGPLADRVAVAIKEQINQARFSTEMFRSISPPPAAITQNRTPSPLRDMT